MTRVSGDGGGTAASCPAENRKKSPGRQIFVLIIGFEHHVNLILVTMFPVSPRSLHLMDSDQ